MSWVFGNSLAEVGEEFSRFTRFEVGDDFKISFWHDVWCGEQSLKEVFLESFCIACLRDAFLVDYL